MRFRTLLRACTLVSCAALVALAVQSAKAESIQETFASANRDVSGGDLEAAQAKLESLAELRSASEDVYFNLASVYVRQNKWGPAAWAMESALRKEPGDLALGDALRAVRERVAEERAERTGRAETRSDVVLSESLLGFFSREALAIWSLAAIAAAIFASLVSRFASARLWKVLAAFAIAHAAVAAGVFAFARHVDGRQVAIVLADAPMTEAPSAGAQVLENLREASRVYIQERVGEHVSVETSEGTNGYVRASAIRWLANN